MKNKSRQNKILLFAVPLAAFGLRIWNILAIGNNFYANTLSDASTYKIWASNIIKGIPLSETVFPMGPLYPYFLASMIQIGFNFYSVLFFQALIGTLTVIFIGLTANRIFNPTSAIITMILTAVYAPFIFYDGLLLSESLQIFLVSTSLFFIVSKKNKFYKLYRYFIGGLCIGLAALGRGTILLFPLLLIIMELIFIITGKSKDKKMLYRYAVIMLAVIITILPATIHNLTKGDFVLISSNFGINFYIGNNNQATGSYDEPAGLNLTKDFTGRGVAEKNLGKGLKSSEVSAFWSGKVFEYFRESPLNFLGGILRKMWLYVWSFDIPQAESIQIQSDFSYLFKFPMPVFGLILALGLMGIFTAKLDSNNKILIALLFSNILSALIFFVIGRFRLIGAIPLLIFAGYAIELIFKRFKQKDYRFILKMAFIFTGLLIITILPRQIDKKYKIASAYDNVGIFNYLTGNSDSAPEWYRKALDVYPGHSKALNNMGAYYYSKRNADSAMFYLNMAIDADPENSRSYLNLGHIYMDFDDFEKAEKYFIKAKELAPYGIEADMALKELKTLQSGSIDLANDEDPSSFIVLFNLAEEKSARGEYNLAETYYLQALKYKPTNLKTLNNLGFVYQVQQKFDKAVEIFNMIISLYGDNAIVYNNLASTLYRMGQIDSSIVVWEKALKVDPENNQIINNLQFAKSQR